MIKHKNRQVEADAGRALGGWVCPACPRSTPPSSQVFPPFGGNLPTLPLPPSQPPARGLGTERARQFIRGRQPRGTVRGINQSKEKRKEKERKERGKVLIVPVPSSSKVMVVELRSFDFLFDFEPNSGPLCSLSKCGMSVSVSNFSHSPFVLCGKRDTAGGFLKLEPLNFLCSLS